MVDLVQLQKAIDATPPGEARHVLLTRTWLEQVAIEISAGAAARAELAAIRAQGATTGA